MRRGRRGGPILDSFEKLLVDGDESKGRKPRTSIPFPPIRPQHFSECNGIDENDVDEEGKEVEEVIIEKPVDGCGLWYQADVIARAGRDKGAGL